MIQSPSQPHHYTRPVIACQPLMHRHCYFMRSFVHASLVHWYCASLHYYCIVVNYSYPDMLLYCYMARLYTVTSWSYTTGPIDLHALIVYVFLFAWIMMYISTSWLFLDSRYIEHYFCYMYYCSMWFRYSSYMIVSCYWYGYSRYWTWELLIRDIWNPTSIVPVSCYIVPVILFSFPVILCYAINRALVQLSCYPYHVLY